MRKYEYKVLQNQPEIEKEFNALGQVGWELICHNCDENNFIFKREIYTPREDRPKREFNDRPKFGGDKPRGDKQWKPTRAISPTPRPRPRAN